MTTKRQEIERLKRLLSGKTSKIEELHEIIGVERYRADTFRKEADFWQQKATALGAELGRLRRQGTPILQETSAREAEKEENGDQEAGAKLQKVYISQPMRGKTDEEILAERDRIRAQLQYDFGDFIELQTYKQENKGKAPLEALGDGIKLMAQADIVVFAPGWDNNRGCMIEHLCAELYSKPIRYIRSD